MTTSHWTDAHIDSAWDDTCGKMYYTGYDEGGHPIICNEDRARVVAHLEAHAARMEYTNSVSQRTSPTVVHPGDVLCTEFGEFLVVCTSPSQCDEWGTYDLMHIGDSQLVRSPVTGMEIVIDDFAPFLHEQDVYQVRRHDAPPPPATRKYNVSPSGPFRDWNITLSVLDAINDGHFPDACEFAHVANPTRSVDHVKDFIHYLMEG